MVQETETPEVTQEVTEQAPTEIAATEGAPAQTEGEAPRGRGGDDDGG